MSTALAASPVVRAAREDLAAAHRLAVRDGLNEGTWNHLSLTHPEDPSRMLITPSYTYWSQVTASGLVDVGPDNVQAEDELAWTAYRIHHPLHAARSDCACVLHVHSPHIVAMAMLEDCHLRMADLNAVFFHGRIAYNDECDALFDDLDQGRRMAEALGDRHSVLLLRHHGAVVTGPTVAAAYTDLYLLDRACRAQILALSTGVALRELSEATIARLPFLTNPNAQKGFTRRHFDAMRRVLDAEEPGYSA